FGKREGSPRLRLEFLDIRLARLVRAGARCRHFRRNVEQRRDLGVDAGEGVERPRDELGLEVQLRTHAADEARRRFEAERRPRERALLLLEQAGEVDRPAVPQVVARGEAVDRRGGDRECGALLELRAHLSRTPLEQRVGVLEGDLAGGVVDAVIGVACEQPAAHTRQSEEHTSELQSLAYLVCRLLLEKKNEKT